MCSFSSSVGGLFIIQQACIEYLYMHSFYTFKYSARSLEKFFLKMFGYEINL